MGLAALVCCSAPSRKGRGAVRLLATLVLCLAVAAIAVAACGGDGDGPSPTPQLTSTVTPAPTLTPTTILPQFPTAQARETATPSPSPLDGFSVPDSVAGIGDVSEALVQGHLFQLEVARTPSERGRGLMDRPVLPEDAAMVFAYSGEEFLGFWMKNTLIPLDILFLDSGGVVVDVQTMHTQIGIRDGALTIYRSARPARYAIEMNAGLAQALGILPGAQVLFR